MKEKKMMLAKRSPDKLEGMPQPPSKKNKEVSKHEHKTSGTSVNKADGGNKHHKDNGKSSVARSKANLGQNSAANREKDANLPFYKKYGKRNYEFKLPKTKHEQVYEILKRWWYCMPDWPEAGIDYTATLNENKLRKISTNWNFAPELDEHGIFVL